MQNLATNKGFSLIEVMVALVILSVGMLGVGTMLVYSLQSDRSSIRTRNAEFICMKKIEELKAMKPTGGWSGVTAEDGADKDWVWIPPSEPVEIDSNYVRRWKLSTKYLSDGTTDSGLKQLQITVGWPKDADCTKADTAKCKHQYKMTTYFKPLQ